MFEELVSQNIHSAEDRKNIENTILETERKASVPRFDAKQMTSHIQKYIPDYQLDCSDKALQAREALHNKARKALHDHAKKIYRDNPYSEMAAKVFTSVSHKRYARDIGQFVQLFMDEKSDKGKYTQELSELAELAGKPKKTKEEQAELTQRSAELLRQINLRTTAMAKDKFAEYKGLSPEKTIEKYSEILTFCTMCDTGNLYSDALKPDELEAYHKTCNATGLNLLAIAKNNVHMLGSEYGKVLDPFQLTAATQDQITAMKGNMELSVYAVSDETRIEADPADLAYLVAGGRMSEVIENLSETYPAFRRQYTSVPDGVQIYKKGYADNLVFKTPDGRELKQSEAVNEIFGLKRPVYISTTNAPEQEPVLVMVNQKREPYYGEDGTQIGVKTVDDVLVGPEAAKEYLAEQKKNPVTIPEPDMEKPVPPQEPELEGWEWFKNLLADIFDAIYINGDLIRPQSMKDYYDRKEKYDEKKEAYDEVWEKYNKREAEKESQDKKIIVETQKVVATDRDLKKGVAWNDITFHQKLVETGLPEATQEKLLDLYQVLTESKNALSAQLMEKGEPKDEFERDGLRDIAASGITCVKAERLLVSEVAKLADERPDHPTISDALTDLITIEQGKDPKEEMNNKLYDESRKLSEALKADKAPVTQEKVMSVFTATGVRQEMAFRALLQKKDEPENAAQKDSFTLAQKIDKAPAKKDDGPKLD